MPAPAPSSTAAASDRKLIVTILATFALLSVVVGLLGYQYFKHEREQAQSRAEQRIYQYYSDYTQPKRSSPPQPPAPPPQAAPAPPSMAQKLLAHPGVTPGVGFSSPGVQSTGIAIIDAIDQAQATEKARMHR